MFKKDIAQLNKKIDKEGLALHVVKKNSFLHRFVELKRAHQMWVLFVAFISTVLVWKGLQNLLELYWFSRHGPFMSNLTAILLGLFIIASTHYAVKKI